MGNEINRDSAVYFDSEARVVPARLDRGISRGSAPEASRVAGRSADVDWLCCSDFSRAVEFFGGTDIYLPGYFYIEYWEFWLFLFKFYCGIFV